MSITRLEILFFGCLLKIRPTILVDVLKTILGTHRRVVETIHGKFWIDPLSSFGQTIAKQRGFEPETVQVLNKYCLRGGTFVDIGANEGYFSILAARLIGPSGRVISIEPQERLLSVIKENARLNDLKNIEILNYAVSDSNQTSLNLYLSPTTNTGSSSLARKYFIAQRQPVKSQCLDSLFEKLSLTHVNLVKVDVEGFDPEVIWGARSILSNQRINALLIDFHLPILQRRKIDPKELHLLILSYGYQHINNTFNENGYNLYTVNNIKNSS